MIININKLTSVKNIPMDLTNTSPIVYLLFYIDENTPRYKRINGQYIPDPNGSYLIDHGIDILNRVPRVLKYIGQALNGGYRRLTDHYVSDLDKLDLAKKGKDKAGIGPIFTHLRIIKNYKILNYDSIRIHLETLLVRKYLPEKNLLAQLTENQIIIILNSQGKITPYDFVYPYKINFKDIYEAYQAWLIEDMDYIKNNFVAHVTKNKAGLNRKNAQGYRKRGVKIAFSTWLQKSVVRYHKKQKEAYTEFVKLQHIYIKTYDPDRYYKTVERIKYLRKGEKYKIRERQYRKMYRLNKRQNNQPELI